MNVSQDKVSQCCARRVRAGLLAGSLPLGLCLTGCFEQIPDPTPTAIEEDVDNSYWCATIDTASADGNGGNYPAPVREGASTPYDYPQHCDCIPDYWLIAEALDGSAGGSRVVTASDSQELQDFRSQLFAGAVTACETMASNLYSGANPPYTDDDCDEQLVVGSSAITVDNSVKCSLRVPYDYDTGDTGGEGAQPLPSDHWSDYYTLSSVIQYNSSTELYEIDGEFFDDMLANPGWLLGDSAYVTLSGSDWTLYGVVSGEVVHALGLESGDVPLELNGYDITSPVGALNAYSSLKTATSFTLVVERQASSITLDYSVI